MRHRPVTKLAWIAPMRMGSGADLPWPLPFPASASRDRHGPTQALRLRFVTTTRRRLHVVRILVLTIPLANKAHVEACGTCGYACPHIDMSFRRRKLEAAAELSLFLPHFHNLPVDKKSSLQLCSCYEAWRGLSASAFTQTASSCANTS